MSSYFTSRYNYDLHIREKDHRLLDVFRDGNCYGFANESPNCLSDANGMQTWTLARAMSLQATNADSPLGSMKHVLSHLATDVRVSHNSVEADLNEARSRFHAAATKAEGSAASFILRAVLQINSHQSVQR